MIVLATDSGLERTGYALFKKENEGFNLIKCGLILTKKSLSLESRLMMIYENLLMIIKRYKPEVMIIEKIFFNINQKTAILVAQTQGALLLLAAKHHIKVEFLTPLTIKQTLTGYGRANKQQIKKMVKLILPKEKLLYSDDIIDAIACGLAYFYLKKT